MASWDRRSPRQGPLAGKFHGDADPRLVAGLRPWDLNSSGLIVAGRSSTRCSLSSASEADVGGLRRGTGCSHCSEVRLRRQHTDAIARDCYFGSWVPLSTLARIATARTLTLAPTAAAASGSNVSCCSCQNEKIS